MNFDLSARIEHDPWLVGAPPLGLVPRFIVTENRLVKIDEAIHRYLSNHLPIPVEWITERNELIEFLRERQT